MYGNDYSFVNSSFPINGENGTIIGTIEFSILISKNQNPNKKDKKSAGDTAFNGRKKLYTCLLYTSLQDPQLFHFVLQSLPFHL